MAPVSSKRVLFGVVKSLATRFVYLRHLFALSGRPFPTRVVFASLIWSTVVLLLHKYFDLGVAGYYFVVPWQYLVLYGFALSFLLAFRCGMYVHHVTMIYHYVSPRLNIANARWWEARCGWGAHQCQQRPSRKRPD